MPLSKLQGVKLPASADFHGTKQFRGINRCKLTKDSPSSRWSNDGIGDSHYPTRRCEHRFRYGKRIYLLGWEQFLCFELYLIHSIAQPCATYHDR